MSKLNRVFDLAQQALDKTPKPAPRCPRPREHGLEGSRAAGRRHTRREAGPADKPSARTGHPRAAGRRRRDTTATGSAHPAAPGQIGDRDAVARYEYLLRTAPPEQLEQIHHDAFTRLTPADREQLAARMRTELPPGEQPRTTNPDDLARAATRTEISRPGTLTPLMARATPALAGTAAAGGLLAAVAGGAIISTLAAPLLLDAVAAGVDFTALADTVNLQEIAGVSGELAAGASESLGGAADAVTGLGDQVTGIGDHLSNIGIPGLGDIFGR